MSIKNRFKKLNLHGVRDECERLAFWSWFSSCTFTWTPGLNSGHQTYRSSIFTH